MQWVRNILPNYKAFHIDQQQLNHKIIKYAVRFYGVENECATMKQMDVYSYIENKAKYGIPKTNSSRYERFN